MNFLFALMQIVLESLPISSSGHLALLGLQESAIWDRFLHGPTVVVILLYFWRELWNFMYVHRYLWRELVRWFILIVFADSVTVLVYALIERFSLSIPLWFGFVCTGCALLSLQWVTECVNEQKNENRHPLVAMGIIGCTQGFARFAGVSRLGITYVVASWLGFSPRQAFRISCAIQVPLFIAGFLEGAWGVLHLEQIGEVFSGTAFVIMVIGMIGAYCLLALVEYLMITHRLWWLGLYMFIPAMIALLQ